MKYGKHIYSKGLKKAAPTLDLTQILSNKTAISKRGSHGRFNTGKQKINHKIKHMKGSAKKWRTKI